MVAFGFLLRHGSCRAALLISTSVGALCLGGAVQAQDPPAAQPPANTPAPASSAPAGAPSSTAPAERSNITLPTVTVQSRRRKPPRAAAVPAPTPIPQSVADTQDARTGTVGVYSNSTSVATKTNTPLLNIPQSITVVNHNMIQDQSYPSLTEVTRYIPGVAVHQGEGNRDELVIRGVDSSANFFVNGFRDDVQYFRDVYNAQSIEVLRGPSALTFGRGAGGGLLNRTLKEADGQRIYEATAQTGSYADRRFTVDAGQAINQDWAARLNMMYEGSDTFRDYGKLERYGINPTVTYRPDNLTKIQLSYELYHDERTADRGNPSQATSAAGSTRFNPGAPFAPNGDLTAFYGSPNLNVAKADVQQLMSVIEHDFQNGLTVKNSTMYAKYDKFYQNVYPGGPAGTLLGAVNPGDTVFNRQAYQHWTNRDNAINQTDFVYKTFTGPVFHTVAFGTEFVRQAGIDLRNTGFFPNGTATLADNPFNPTYTGPITFTHIASDSNSVYRLYTESYYARDTIELTRWLQLIGGVRFDRFDLVATDQNTFTRRSRDDSKVSPQAAVIVKPVDNLSIYAAYSISYLPASGDQFSSLNNGTIILVPQEFENKEIGLKWEPKQNLQYTAAVYELNRSNVPIADPNNPGLFLATGSHKIRGFENGLTGYITKDWQSSLGYAYTDARITSDTSTTVVAGNRVQLVPYNQFSWWNKYQFLPNWAASVGAIYFSDSYASSDDTVRLPGFVRFDAGLFWTIDKTWKAQLNVENIFNKGYWASADGNNNISPGESRTFRVKMIAKL